MVIAATTVPMAAIMASRAVAKVCEANTVREADIAHAVDIAVVAGIVVEAVAANVDAAKAPSMMKSPGATHQRCTGFDRFFDQSLIDL
jgi:hypothetical protein